MARIPESEIERLKLRVSVERLVEAAGVVLRPHGKDRVGRCPFHDDKTPSLVVSPRANLWHCLGACQRGGSAIDWVMKFEGVSFRHAVERLKRELGESGFDAVPPRPDERTATEGRAGAPHQGGLLAGQSNEAATTALLAAADDDPALLRWVVDYYHATLQQSTEAKRYLDARGLYSVEAIATFQLGFANRTLGYRVPGIQVKAGARLRAALQRVGLYRETGREHFNGSLVVPVIAPTGEITEVYGRKVTPNLRAGTPLHLYLPGPHRGVFNEQGLVGQEEVILCEALLDALTFWCAGYRNVTSSYGIEGFTPDLLAAFKRHGIVRVLIAYDADAAGNGAADRLATKLMAEGFACYRCRFPKGMDANEYALAVKPAVKSLGVVIRQAEWLGQGAAPLGPTSHSQLEIFPDDSADVAQAAAVVFADRSDTAPAVAASSPSAPAPVLPLAAALAVEAVEAVEKEQEQSQRSGASPSLQPSTADVAPDFVPAHRLPPTAPPLPVTIGDSGALTLTLADRVYRVRGIEKNLSYEQLKVWLRASRADFVHLDTLDLAQGKQRAAWLKAAGIELGMAEDQLRGDLAKLLRVVEERQQALIEAQLQAKSDPPTAAPLTPAQHDAAMALLRDPHLIDRIVADVEATGVVGEASNALVAYLACVSRKLDRPLAILIQSTSAAGKSTLMDALLALMPEAERVHYSAMTGQSLFYLGETSMKHKILAIAEEAGVRQAAYALKVLQSAGELTIASTGKDPTTGDLQTKTYTVEGPVMLFLTTTAIDIDEELLNRCLVLTINESREQTAAIQARQRSRRTLAGLLTQARSDDILATHRTAQQLLRPLAVVNPYAEQLTFASDRVRLRRDHQKYLALIDSIALLHQYQRPIRSAAHAGKTIDYIEVTADDIALANRLAHEVLGRSLDELPPQTRRLLGQAQRFVAERAEQQAIELGLVRFTRRELRDYTHLSNSQLAVHMERLLELEYLCAHAGRNGQRFVYELLFDGDVEGTACRLPGLFDGAEPVSMTADLPASEAHLPARFRGASGPLPATFRLVETSTLVRTDAVLPLLVAAVDPTADPGAPPAQRRNGASYAGRDAPAPR